MSAQHLGSLANKEQRHGVSLPFTCNTCKWNLIAMKFSALTCSCLFNITSDFHQCLYCAKTKEAAEGIRSQMIDRGHCMIATNEELDQFYEFAKQSDEVIGVREEGPLAKDLPYRKS